MKPWTARRLSNLSRGQAGVMALLVMGLVCLFLGSLSLFPLLRVSYLGLNVLNSAEDIDAFQKSGLNSGVSLAYTKAQKLPGGLVLTQNKTHSMSVSLPYLYVEFPVSTEKEFTFLHLYRLSGEDYQVLLVSRKELASPVFVSMEYSDFYPEWRDLYLDSGPNRYVFAASASPRPFILFMLGLGVLLLILLLLLHCFRPFWLATPFGRQLAGWGKTNDVEHDLNAALSFPFFESGALLLTDRWLILGGRRHPHSAPILTKSDHLLSACLLPGEDEETQFFLTFLSNTGEEGDWFCWLTQDEASRLQCVWPLPCKLEKISDTLA